MSISAVVFLLLVPFLLQWPHMASGYQYDQRFWPQVNESSMKFYRPRGQLNMYEAALSAHNPSMIGLRDISELMGRLMRGRSPPHFRSLHYDLSRRIVSLIGPDGLHSLLHKTGYQMLIELGWTPEAIKHNIVVKKKHLKLVVFHKSEKPAPPATWDNLMTLLQPIYPDIYGKIAAQLQALKVPWASNMK
jgi:hypothetical protein